jgi:NTP pyrophosphatase (non-canonical NTP hydrolase)
MEKQLTVIDAVPLVFNELGRQIDQNADAHGFNEDWKSAITTSQRNVVNGMKIALIHSEISEALEAIRKNIEKDDHIPEFTGLEAELADAVIRILHLAHQNNVRLGEAIEAKMAYNAKRSFKHGGKAF